MPRWCWLRAKSCGSVYYGVFWSNWIAVIMVHQNKPTESMYTKVNRSLPLAMAWPVIVESDLCSACWCEVLRLRCACSILSLIDSLNMIILQSPDLLHSLSLHLQRYVVLRLYRKHLFASSSSFHYYHQGVFDKQGISYRTIYLHTVMLTVRSRHLLFDAVRVRFTS